MSEIEDYDFISNVKALASNGTLAELLRRLGDDAISDWRVAKTPEKREEAHATVRAIEALKTKITSLVTDEKVRAFNSQKRVYRRTIDGR